jgi:hypothetical protein
MIGFASVHERPAVVGLRGSCCRPATYFAGQLWRELFRGFGSWYRPERHYMRGPGPRWREKYAAVAARLGDGNRCDRFVRAETEGIVSEVAQPAKMNQRVAGRPRERRETARPVSRKTGKLAAIGLERDPTEAREIVEARRLLIAELEERRRLPCDGDPGLREGA